MNSACVSSSISILELNELLESLLIVETYCVSCRGTLSLEAEPPLKVELFLANRFT